MDFWWIVVIAFFAVALIVICGNKSKFQISPPVREGYRDPLWMNTSMLTQNYAKSNGSIYGFARTGCGKRNSGPWNCGSWNIFTGYAYYDKAY